MYKICFIFCLALVVAVVTGELSTSVASPWLARNDDYLHLNHLQYAKVLEDLDEKLEFFKELFTGRVGVLDLQLEMIADSVVRTENRLNPFELLGSDFKRCVVKYRVVVPNLLKTKTDIAACASEATKELGPLLSLPLSTRNSLEAYYANDYKHNLKDCEDKNDITSANYTICITAATAKSNEHTVAQQKIFKTQLEAAECSAQASVKKALDCSYSIESHTISRISEATVLIKNCLEGKDECKPCEAYTCAESYDLQADYESDAISNPFKGRYANATCLMLNFH